MTRKEERELQSIKYGTETPSERDNELYDLTELEWAYEAGAEWADKTMIDRVCKVIEEMLPNYVELDYVFEELSVNYHKFKNNFISDLRKAIEE